MRKRVRIKQKDHRSHFTMYSPRVKLFGCSWKFTIGDSDDHPSVPHAHSVIEGYRLDAWTGDVYPKGKERKNTIGKLKRRELDLLHKDPKFIAFAQSQIKWYRNEYPHIRFYVPEWFKRKHLRYGSEFASRIKEGDSLVFKGAAYITVKESATPSHHKCYRRSHFRSVSPGREP